MMARLAHLLPRLSVASVALCSAFAIAACNGRAATGTSAPTAESTQAATTASAESAQHGPGNWMFRQIQALDLRDDQRASVVEIQENLKADLLPHQETLRQVATGLADAIESGHLDASDAAAHQAALVAAIADAKAAFATAMNSVHDTLDATQRATLVEQLRAQHEGRTTAAGPADQNGPLAKLAFQIGLTEDQKVSLKQAVQAEVDDLFPDHKTQREANEARMKAMAQAFVSEDFDANDFDVMGDASQRLESFAEAATRAISLSERMLSLSQRQAIASLVRSRATKL